MGAQMDFYQGQAPTISIELLPTSPDVGPEQQAEGAPTQTCTIII